MESGFARQVARTPGLGYTFCEEATQENELAKKWNPQQQQRFVQCPGLDYAAVVPNDAEEHKVTTIPLTVALFVEDQLDKQWFVAQAYLMGREDKVPRRMPMPGLGDAFTSSLVSRMRVYAAAKKEQQEQGNKKAVALWRKKEEEHAE